MRSYRVHREHAGIVKDFAGPESSVPGGWLLCFGQALDTTVYARLFSVLGYTYGGAGASFSLPDYRGRVTAGADNMGGVTAGVVAGLTHATNSGAESKAVGIGTLSPVDGIGVSDLIVISDNIALASASLTEAQGGIHRHQVAGSTTLSTGAISGAGSNALAGSAYYDAMKDVTQTGQQIVSNSGGGGLHAHAKSGSAYRTGSVTKTGTIALSGQPANVSAVQPSTGVNKIIKI